MNQFIPGLELNRRFYFEAIKPILTADFSDLQFSAARMGRGSEVLGYDTPLSTDHDWGPRLQLLMRSGEYEQFHAQVNERLRHRLPRRILGYPTHRIIDASRFVEALKAQISDPVAKTITTDIGSIDQFSHGTDLRSYPHLHKKLQLLYK